MTTPPNTTSEESTDASDESFDIIHKSTELLYDVSAEGYLSLPEEILALTSVEELEEAVENCKSVILSEPENSEKKKWLVRRLIELRLRLENIKDKNEETSAKKENNKVVLGHHFSLQSFLIPTVHHFCDRCSEVIWNIMHNWYICSDCKYKCHAECLSYVCRTCAHIVVTEKPEYILEICPEAEDGLANQNYRCAECLTHTSFGNNVSEPRLCDYTGKYYCPTCHWNSTSVIPARIVWNWDFKARNICRSSKQILQLMSKLPVLKLEELNPVLFACIEELGSVKELRRQLMQIKKYLISCKSAEEEQLLWRCVHKIHFLESEDNYSVQDLLELRSGDLIKYLTKIRNGFIKHIRVDCEVCQGRGFCCELCKDEKIIFPFEENIMSCAKCSSAFHFFCWMKNNERCPKCIRIQQKMLKNEGDEISTEADS